MTADQHVDELPDDSLGNDLPAVPAFEIDRFRNRVDTSGTLWRFNDPSVYATADWSFYPESEVRHAAQLWICYCIRAHSPRESGNQFRDIKFALGLQTEQPSKLEDLDLGWWRNLRQRMRECQTPYRLHRVRAWFHWLADQGIAGVDQEAAIELESWVVPGNEKGEAVTRRDKDAGPLNELQFAVLIQAVRRPQPVTCELAATMLCIDLGSNPKNLLLIEERDFHVFIDPKTAKRSYLVDVPRIKKRLDRRKTKRRKLTAETGAVIESLIERNHQRFGCKKPNRPILCQHEARRAREGLDPSMDRFLWHHTSMEIYSLVRSYGGYAHLRTPGAGDTSFKITPRRLRYTFGTRLAAQGAAPAIIAELLDHSDLQHVMVYIDAAGQLADELTSTIGPAVKLTYDRFLGKIVDRPEDAVPNDPAKHVMARVSENMLGSVGTCGSGTLCRLAPPLTCYLCDNFQPWRHADHEGLLGNLRTFVEADTPSGGGRDLIARVIVAVESVVKLKNQREKPS